MQNIPRNQRSVMAKFLCGIMPIEVETGRFRNVKELRFCKMCESKTLIEDEMHFLHVCTKTQEARDEHIAPLKAGFEGDATEDKVGFTKYLLQDDTNKDFAKALEAMAKYRRDLQFRPL